MHQELARNKQVLIQKDSKITASIVLSSSMREQYACYPDMRVYLVANFSEKTISHDLLMKKKFKSDGVLQILYLSNLIPSKGLLELIRAVIESHQCGIDIKLNIAGSALGHEKFLSVVKSYSRRYDFISFLGSVVGDDKWNLLENSDVLALPTYYPTEAQPICLIEGMSFGCVIMTTRQGYIANIVEHENGIFVKKESVSSIASALGDICHDLEKMSGVSLQNLEYAKKNFSAGAYIKGIDSVIKQEMEKV